MASRVSAAQRKRALLIAIFGAFVLGGLILGSLAFPVTRLSTIVSIGHNRLICVRCGCQGSSRSIYAFGMIYYARTNLLPSTASFARDAANKCAHKAESTGIRYWAWNLNKFRYDARQLGFADEDFFTNQPAVIRALSSIKQTNEADSEILFTALARMAFSEGKRPVTNLFQRLDKQELQFLNAVLPTEPFASAISAMKIPSPER